MIPVQDDEKSNGKSPQSANTEADEEYPATFKLVMIVVALMLSMFLASLDMVRMHTYHSSQVI